MKKIILSLLSVVSFTVSCSKSEDCFNKKLFKIRKDIVIDNGDARLVTMGTLFNCIEWDTVIVNGPFYTPKFIPKQFEMDEYKSSDNENFSYLFFYDKGEKIKALKLERKIVDFSSLKNKENRTFNYFIASDSIRIYMSKDKFLDGNHFVKVDHMD